ncbi:MAG: glycosyltransferase family 2 protein [bacterium (Candidatus Ratteibacteria) CG_4_9_14_3_um_filter_41_21]|uniref:Glycosyltransferase family 2 protein n=3 Tax=Candidatus Ratteibacteria TaxID=2979319 RepID=A0A2M7YGV0_9BACT|nr:MAG: glycosyltransferase family 2 protein [bacterium (Candidatus Ratteibacteria) CG01_land_8_20_14_3_00_40_19]PIW34049.1 MAG: glycosyltransferase family 2 protein [bacterium (Candidatus Ratteibacteria) CG15_BIG_FIL_POST_REV_8_21_14_020_41_12]PJA62188.1 MAG: glycosyltransferase family 2 protein [bacterium (Candidatus Ratteibacteria) CG_4_9_14_3_um_filter_41_21]HCG76367.1 glycosyltransferase family 2 protein [bacterium]
MEKLSVAIITKNEEKSIGRCLESLKWVDEIVVLDGYSTDRTVKICKNYTNKIYQKQFESFPVERDFVLKKTSHRWVLSVDADMYFLPEICEEIKTVLKSDIKYDAFLMRGLTVFLGKEIRHCGWFDLRYLRLFNKEKGNYDLNLKCIDPFIIKGEIGYLKNHFIHYGGDSFSEYFGKIKRYSYLTALEYKTKGLRIQPYNCLFYLFLKPLLVFIYKYIVKRGFLDGIVGFLVCVNSAITYFASYSTFWDIQRKE